MRRCTPVNHHHCTCDLCVDVHLHHTVSIISTAHVICVSIPPASHSVNHQHCTCTPASHSVNHQHCACDLCVVVHLHHTVSIIITAHVICDLCVNMHLHHTVSIISTAHVIYVSMYTCITQCQSLALHM